MCHYHHLTLSEREMIMYFLAQGCSISQIALKLNRNKSTISRELGRNAGNEVYRPAEAQQKYVMRRKSCHPRRKLDNPMLSSFVKDKFLNQQWSPEEIAGRLAYETHKAIISANTIYRGIYAGCFDDFPVPCSCRGVIRKLRHRGKSRHTKGYIENRGKIPISHDISVRPAGA